MIRKVFSQLLFTLVILFVPVMLLIGQITIPENDDDGFEITVIDNDYSLAYSTVIVLTNKRLDVIYKGEIVGEKDTLLFSTSVHSSDTLRQLRKIDVEKLKNYYSNRLVSDGLQMTVFIKKNGKSKTVQLANYYQEAIGKIIFLINTLLSDKYKIWYDKKELQAR